MNNIPVLDQVTTVQVEPFTEQEIIAFLDRLDEAVERGELTEKEYSQKVFQQSALWREA